MQWPSGTLADDPFSGRHPTSHERLAGLPWDASYHDGPAPWDTGQPQPAVVRLASEGGFAGAVLDAGCGTGENALHLASLGLAVLGVGVGQTALAIAGPGTGPHPISQEELRAAFNPSNGWNVAAIEPDRIQTRYHDDGAPAWFATIKRIYTAGLVDPVSDPVPSQAVRGNIGRGFSLISSRTPKESSPLLLCSCCSIWLAELDRPIIVFQGQSHHPAPSASDSTNATFLKPGVG